MGCRSLPQTTDVQSSGTTSQSNFSRRTNDYLIVQRLGSGSFSQVRVQIRYSGLAIQCDWSIKLCTFLRFFQVFHAIHLPDHRHVAIKIFRILDADTGVEEFEILRRLGRKAAEGSSCPHSVPLGFCLIYDPLCFSPCLVQELIGPTYDTPHLVPISAQERPMELKACYQQLSMSQRIQVLRQILQALAHAHGRNIVHRDVKLANVVVCRQHGGPQTVNSTGTSTSTSSTSSGEPGTIRACLIDWGLAIDLPPKKQQLSRVGTFGYKDPIVALGEAVGARAGVHADVTRVAPTSDIWAFGIVAATILLDRPEIHSVVKPSSSVQSKLSRIKKDSCIVLPQTLKKEACHPAGTIRQ